MPYPLGRIIEHDERSRGFRAAQADIIKTVQHIHYGDALDQGNLGSCTGNAMAQLLNTQPLATGATKRYLEPDAVDLYSLATQLDEFSGAYPPDDTGSSGLAVAKAAIKRGYINSYQHTFSINELLSALTLQPVIVGTNWYDGMFTPDSNGVVTISGQIAGGHEYLLFGLDAENNTVMALNSWGPDWGINGAFTISWATLDRLLSEDGDCTVPIKINVPIPTPGPVLPAPEPTDTLWDVIKAVVSQIVQWIGNLFGSRSKHS